MLRSQQFRRLYQPFGALGSRSQLVFRHSFSTNTSAQAASVDTAVNVEDEKESNAPSRVGKEAVSVTIADLLATQELDESTTSSKKRSWWEKRQQRIQSTQSVYDAVKMMVNRNAGSLIVTQEQEGGDGALGIVGIVTERDILKKLPHHVALSKEDAPVVTDVMTSQFVCVHPTTTVLDALATMTKENIRHLAVIMPEVEGADSADVSKQGASHVPLDALKCVVSIKDIIKAYANAKKTAKHEAQNKAEQKQTSNESNETTNDESTVPETREKMLTAAHLLRKKHKTLKMILNTRLEDKISVADAVSSMITQNFGAVLVVEPKDHEYHVILGIFTERDYLTKVLAEGKDPNKTLLIDVCTRNVQSLPLDATLEELWEYAAVHSFRHFPIVGVSAATASTSSPEHGNQPKEKKRAELKGVLSIKDIVAAIAKDHAAATPSGFRLVEFFRSKITGGKSKSDKPKTESPAPPHLEEVKPTESSEEKSISTPPKEPHDNQIKSN